MLAALPLALATGFHPAAGVVGPALAVATAGPSLAPAAVPVLPIAQCVVAGLRASAVLLPPPRGALPARAFAVTIPTALVPGILVVPWLAPLAAAGGAALMAIPAAVAVGGLAVVMPAVAMVVGAAVMAVATAAVGVFVVPVLIPAATAVVTAVPAAAVGRLVITAVAALPMAFDAPVVPIPPALVTGGFMPAVRSAVAVAVGSPTPSLALAIANAIAIGSGVGAARPVGFPAAVAVGGLAPRAALAFMLRPFSPGATGMLRLTSLPAVGVLAAFRPAGLPPLGVLPRAAPGAVPIVRGGPLGVASVVAPLLPAWLPVPLALVVTGRGDAAK